ncbi:MAG: Rieske 2Fe-2S domain-containing protein [Chloroflexi bacterium]|nr:Rieske 2Fe-2S domain-containing protein [Chloroflexota bacterium]
MLSAQENELITRVGPGTPMGNLFRRHWLPAMLSTELPEPDCPPIKLRLLGEDLVAVRLTSGQVAVLHTYCPHRNANLFWGRNEEEGLRCVYHGWKFDVDGNCVDMPNEPPTSNFASKIKQPAYQALDRGGFIWVYMGPRELAPEVPHMDWMDVPDSHRVVHKRMQMCNWLQNLEGEVDSSHVSFLHSNLGQDGMRVIGGSQDRHPVFSVVETEFGLAISARREAPNNQYYWRITPFQLPSYTIVPGTLGGLYIFTGAIPVDDSTMMGMTVMWNPEQAIERSMPIVDVDDKFHAVENKGNDYKIDRALQKTTSYTGIRSVRVQDMAVQEDQRGPISDRTTEHLGTSDMGVIATRRLLLKQARQLEKGIEPAQPHTPEAYHLRSLAITVDRAVPWEELMQEHMLLSTSAKGAAAQPATV